MTRYYQRRFDQLSREIEPLLDVPRDSRTSEQIERLNDLLRRRKKVVDLAAAHK